METETQLFFKAVLNILPENSHCEISTTSTEIFEIMKLIANSSIESNYICRFTLTRAAKHILINKVNRTELEEYMDCFEITFNSKVIFIAYDGFVIGEILNTIKLPDDFINEFVKTGMCIITDKIIF